MRISKIVYTALTFAFVLGTYIQIHSQSITPNPESTLSKKKVMVLTGGNQGEFHGAARDITLSNLKAMAAKVKFTLVEGNPLTLTDAALSGVDILVFNYFFQTELAGVFPVANKEAFQRWLLKGKKGWVGYHTSGANNYATDEWRWYQDNVTLMRYILHAKGSPLGTVEITKDPEILSAPIMQGLPKTFKMEDEWYSYEDKSPFYDSAKVMYYLANAKELGREPFPIHPVAWYSENGIKNRYVYTTFPHGLEAANTDAFKNILLRSLEYVSGDPTSSIIEVKGKSATSANGFAFITHNKTIKINLPGSYNVTISSPSGKQVFFTKGQGRLEFSPSVFRKSGIYIVKVTSKNKKFTQRLLIY